MNKHHFNVSLRGEFVFRTEPETDPERIKQTRDALLAKFGGAAGYCVAEYRTTSQHTFEILTPEAKLTR